MRLAAPGRAFGFLLLAGLALRAAAQPDLAVMAERMWAMQQYVEAVKKASIVDAPAVLPSGYPPENAGISVHIGADGKPEKIALSDTSFHPETDARALEAVRRAVGEVPIPAKLAGSPFRVTVRVHYKETPLQAYRGSVLERSYRIAVYPKGPFERNEQGRVLIGISIGADGKLAGAEIVRGSGYPELDTEALHFVTRAQTAVTIPEELRGRAFKFEVPVIFSLKNRSPE